MREVKSLLNENIYSIDGKIKIVSVSILSQVQKKWVKCLEQLEKTDMYNKMLNNYFDFSLAAEIKSLIIIALPSPPCYVEIEWNSRNIEVDIPPVYIYRDQQLSMIKKIVSNVFEQYQLKSWPVVLPKKILAAMSGFGKYGKNNLLYIEGMGSCHRLTVFGSNMICTDEIELTSNLSMDRCNKCGVCIKLCPTGAIDRNSEKIVADKCLAFFNELNDTLPRWLHNDWHNSLVGCTKCQEQCPENQAVWNRKKIGSFSNVETQMIMKNTSFETIDVALQNKLTDLSLDRYFDVLSRNIMLLLKAKRLL
ncbi:MAG TPA: 4Fe-4S double cluster binding domain-containing protein [Clostridia bacterium]|nr:4Fe-4S double cluster binding domain-containing protein [Clostridia bacterium]